MHQISQITWNKNKLSWNCDKLLILWQISEGDLGLSQPANNTSSNNEIYEDTSECYADLMKSCWDPDPNKKPSIKKIHNTLGSWSFRNKHNDIFDKAELKRQELMDSKKLGPEFSEKPHKNAIYTSRSLNSLISKCSSINSSKDMYVKL
ncbi:kinase-like domain-containing protein [Rhizophagus clarus]|uniref:Kinase-like domain-containing protein n=1 Tax=Rhizophagus clarus TaxID=94130 RepID=A0A8H3L076_9GLOM|nr:kinase-like domain-containing protein [Rhizophagus clarus]